MTIRTLFCIRLAVVAIIGLGITACGSKTQEDVLSGEVKIDGSSTVYPITEAVAEEFRTVAPHVRVTVGISGTGGGFQKFIRGEIDINDASREIKPSEMYSAEERGIEYIQLAIAYDGLAVVIHPNNNWVDKLTVEELRKIWEPAAQGKVNRWNQIREEWPDQPIHLYGPGVASGTYDYFTNAIVGSSGASRGDYTASEDDNVLVQGVANDKFALGFFGLAYYRENMEKLKLLAIQDQGGNLIKPNRNTVAENTYTPLSRSLYIYVTKKAVADPAVQNFVRFYIENAPQLANAVGYVAMPDSLYHEQMNKFNAFVKLVDRPKKGDPKSISSSLRSKSSR
jgi:phosphate transport system substrate-binding protein